jgi:predicted component of type VI protein secretion system
MRMIFNVALLAIFITQASSCSWFASKPAELPIRAELPSDQAAPSAHGAAKRYLPEPNRVAAGQSPTAFSSKETLSILIKADKELNRYGRNCHALFLCLYQLKDPNGFNQLAQEKDGVPKLLECSRFDASVANAKQYVLQPGQELNEVRDRAEGARYLGLATGYYGAGKEKLTEISRLLQAGGNDHSGDSVTIELGPYEISKVQVK